VSNHPSFEAAVPHIAQMNMGYLRHPLGDPRVAGFTDNTDRVNQIADRSPGFVWRMTSADETHPENDIGGLFGRPAVALATLSVWERYEDFAHFVHNTVHGHFLKRRAEWFEPLDLPSYVIWPIAMGHIPSLAEGKEKLMQLRANGPSADAYDFAYRSAKGPSAKPTA
jgi:hypothetical protein